MEKGYKFRIYPNAEQVSQIEETFGACRWVWNYFLELRIAAWQANKKGFSNKDLMRHLTDLKKTVAPWLYDVSNPALQQTLRDLDKAYANFFRRCKSGAGKKGFPKWKRKSSGRQSYRVPAENGKKARVVDDKHVKIPKLGIVKCRVSRELEGRILSATIRRVPSGKYYVTFICTDIPEPDMPLGDNVILGIDAGIHDLMVRSDGVHMENNKYLKASEKRLKWAQRSLSRRKKGSKNYQKQRNKVARIHERGVNQRTDAIHKATTDAVRESQAIATENLNVEGMMRNHKIAKSASDASMAEAIRQLEYKCRWYGRDFVKVDRMFPSTQLCGCCGEVVGPKGLRQLYKRDWTCPSCGTHHDRDLNAARNIARKGSELLGYDQETTVGHTGRNACGEDKDLAPSAILDEAGIHRL